MFCSLIIIKKINLKKRPTDYNLISFWILAVKDWSETRPINAYRPLGALNFSNVIDRDNMLVKNSNINSAFLIINE